ncbi:MAG TPA: sigma-70 family RNA polymerase sigma factor [Phycisphaerales bacterium]|nr:sigma-70 family RNA polymerase sigma factor [Phycisphaerales bacterium]
MIEDKLLIWKFKRGDTGALRQIYEKYKNDLLKLAVVMTGNAATAEDTVQDVFVRFAQSGDRIRSAGSLKSYLTTSVVNRIRTQWRDGQRHAAVNIDEASEIPSKIPQPQNWALLSEELMLLKNAMTQLPEDQREVIALRMQGDMSFRQIAKLQNVSISTAQGRYRYGITKLRSILNGEVLK